MSTQTREVRRTTARLNLLQDFEIVHDGHPVALAPSLQRLVCFLAFRRHPQRRACVSGTLWFDVDEHRASASLRSALWRLNPLGIVGSSHTHLWLDPSVEVDLSAVNGHALAVLRSKLPEDELLDIARELIDVGDDVLPGWYDEWVVDERERFRQVRLHALDRIGEQLIQSGRWCDALQVALAVTGTEPLRESAHRLLIRVHLFQGNIAEAVRQYRRYAALIREELNARPSPVIQALVAPHLRGALT